jgi:prepilin-type N-terminal cleavage/methylation domain-containing protein
MERSNRSGFTLIELIIVVGIIGILVTVLLAVLLSATGRGDESTAENFVKNIVPFAITEWQEETERGTGTYPRSPNIKGGKDYVDGNIELFDELVTKREKAGKAPLVAADHYDAGTHNGKPVFMDPWGNPYIYRNYVQKTGSATAPTIVGKTYNDTYDLISCGPDGNLDNDDDICRGKD